MLALILVRGQAQGCPPIPQALGPPPAFLSLSQAATSKLGGFCSSVQITIFLCSGFEFPRQLSTLCWLSKINMDTKGAGVADNFHSTDFVTGTELCCACRCRKCAEGTSGFRACPYSSSFKPSTSTSKPVQSGYQQKASDQPVQSAYQQVASPKPVWSSSPPSFVSQKVGFDSSAVGLSGSRAYSYTPSFTPSTSASQPVQSTYQQKPVQTASQRVASAQPVLSSYRSGLYSQNVGFDSSAGTGSGVSSYTSSFRPPTSISKPVPSSYQQVTLSQPVQSRYQDVPFSQTSYGASLSGVTSTGSRSVYTPSDSVASAQAFRSPYSYAQALSSLDNSQPSAGSPRLTWTQKVLE
ncbi:hypothetical protein MHYP_G00273760 [Metynnis hypsauchen]